MREAYLWSAITHPIPREKRPYVDSDSFSSISFLLKSLGNISTEGLKK